MEHLQISCYLPKSETIFLCYMLKAILANVASIRRTLEEVESCKGELHLPREAEESLLIFPRAALLLQMLQELEQLSKQQAAQLKVCVAFTGKHTRWTHKIYIRFD